MAELGDVGVWSSKTYYDNHWELGVNVTLVLTRQCGACTLVELWTACNLYWLVLEYKLLCAMHLYLALVFFHILYTCGHFLAHLMVCLCGLGLRLVGTIFSYLFWIPVHNIVPNLELTLIDLWSLIFKLSPDAVAAVLKCYNHVWPCFNEEW